MYLVNTSKGIRVCCDFFDQALLHLVQESVVGVRQVAADKDLQMRSRAVKIWEIPRQNLLLPVSCSVLRGVQPGREKSGTRGPPST